MDRFGLRWQIVPAVLDEMMSDDDPVRSKRVTDALLKMVTVDITALLSSVRAWSFMSRSVLLSLCNPVPPASAQVRPSAQRRLREDPGPVR